MTTTANARKTRRRWTLALTVLVLAVLVVAFTAVEPMRITSQSMSPSYDIGDEVLVGKLGSHVGALRHGDVIVFHEPGSGALTIKRVAALAGEEIGIEDGVLTVNGASVSEDYLEPSSVDGTYFGPVQVPAGRVFVLGDARAGSVDSRTFGAVAGDAIVGRVLTRLWSGRR